MSDEKPAIEWPEFESAKSPENVRKQFNQEWPVPDRTIDPALPKPWVIVGYSSSAVDAVLRVDYGAFRKGNVWHVPGGEIRREHDYHGLRGQEIGTLLVLPDPHGRALERIDMAIEVAVRRGAQVVFIHSGAHDYVF